MDRSFSLTLYSTFRESEKIPDFVDQIRDECTLNEESSEMFKLVLSEAVTNAIVHGNKENGKKTVDIKVQVTDTAITGDVMDQGEGFDPGDKKDPLKEENLLDTSGRGVFLINQFADYVEYKNNGSHLHFRVDLQDSEN